jgi:flavin reductase (DIM6/NTAB) family NADH-FMN oxidoreductase RutF
MKRVNPLEVTDTIMTQLGGAGAFLTVKSGALVNTMTIGWAQLGVIWGKTIMTVMVRPSRYTYGLIEKSEDFTVSVPLEDMSRELKYCGSHSRRDGDKFEALNLQTVKGQKVHSPVLVIPGIHLECRILFKSALDAGGCSQEIRKFYPQEDFHTLYFGEIVNCYETSEKPKRKATKDENAGE